MLKRYLLLLLFLFFSVSSVFSQEFVLVPIDSLSNWQNSKQNSIEYIRNLINCKIQLESDLGKWIGKSEEQAKLIIEKDSIILNLSIGLENEKKRTEEKSKLFEESNEIWKEKEAKLIASFQADQIKLGFIVGGITFAATVSIAVPLTIYIYEKYFK